MNSCVNWPGCPGRPFIIGFRGSRLPQHARRKIFCFKQEIRKIHAESRGTYGVPRMTAALKAKGWERNAKRVERLMKEEELQGIVHKTRRGPNATDSEHAQPVSENILNRQFSPEGPNQAWSTDITYVPTLEGWLYCAVIIDLFSKKVIGCAMAEHMRASLCVEVLNQATGSRQPPPGVIHHSDRGSRYTSREYRQKLEENGMVQSMSRKGNCWDNAVSESFFGTLKQECVHRDIFPTRKVAKMAINHYIYHSYNPKRIHSALGFHSPIAFGTSSREVQSHAALSLFYFRGEGHNEGGESLTILQTIIATCLYNKVNPQEDITDVLIQSQETGNPINTLMPWNWKAQKT